MTMTARQWARNADALLAAAPDTSEAWREIACAPRTSTQRDDSDGFGRSGLHYPKLSAPAQDSLAASRQWVVRAQQALDAGEVRGPSRARVEREIAARSRDLEYLLGAVFRLMRTIVIERVQTRLGTTWSDEVLPDMMGEAYSIAINAADAYDPQRCSSFPTYLAARLRAEILNAVDPMVVAGSAPPSWHRVARIAAAREKDLQAELGRTPTAAEITEGTWRECRRWAEEKLSGDEAKLRGRKRAAAIEAKLVKQGMSAAMNDLDKVRAALGTTSSLDGHVRVDDADGESQLGAFLAADVDVAGDVLDMLDRDRVAVIVRRALASLPPELAANMADRLTGAAGDGRDEAAVAIRSLRARVAAPHAQFAALAEDIELDEEVTVATARDALRARLGVA